VDDEDRCLYAGTLWEAEVVTDRRDLETFKEAARTIASVLLVRTLVDLLRFLLPAFEFHEVQLSVVFVVQSLVERAQAQTVLLLEAANAQAEAVASHEVKLQAEIRAASEIQCVKEVMARQAQKEAADLKKLEDAEQKAKDAASNLQAMVDGDSSTWPWADSACLARSWSESSTLNYCRRSRDRGGPQEGASHNEEPADGYQGEVHGDPTRLASCSLLGSWSSCRDWTCFSICLFAMQVLRRTWVRSKTPPNKSWTSTSRRRRGLNPSC
jgi:hypothetical protein